MYILKILKIEGRRSGKDRRKSDDENPKKPERRSSADRRTSGDRRKSPERRSCTQYILTEQQKLELDRMYDFLEEKGFG